MSSGHAIRVEGDPVVGRQRQHGRLDRRLRRGVQGAVSPREADGSREVGRGHRAARLEPHELDAVEHEPHGLAVQGGVDDRAGGLVDHDPARAAVVGADDDVADGRGEPHDRGGACGREEVRREQGRLGARRQGDVALDKAAAVVDPRDRPTAVFGEARRPHRPARRGDRGELQIRGGAHHGREGGAAVRRGEDGAGVAGRGVGGGGAGGRGAGSGRCRRRRCRRRRRRRYAPFRPGRRRHHRAVRPRDLDVGPGAGVLGAEQRQPAPALGGIGDGGEPAAVRRSAVARRSDGVLGRDRLVADPVPPLAARNEQAVARLDGGGAPLDGDRVDAGDEVADVGLGGDEEEREGECDHGACCGH